jgi:protein-ribulosamine 3-kinase
MPSFVPQPHAWGKFQISNPATYFFLCEYIEMANDMPDPVQFCSRVAELHKVSKSPTDCFGFHATTCQGKFPQAVQWDPSWQSFFRKMLLQSIRIDIQENGTWEELDKISARIVTDVIPLLLGPLESEGRHVKPSLIHGDLWDGNCKRYINWRSGTSRKE